MKRVLAAVAMMVWAASYARAEDAPACVPPAYLLATESQLPKVAAAVQGDKRLNILVIGSGSSALAGLDGVAASYPARLEAALRERLPGVAVTVRTELRPKKLASEAAEGFAAMLAKPPPEQKPALVIWQTGTVDAMRAIDPDDFRAALEAGVTTLQKAGTDALMMNLQYNPRMDTMLSVSPYNDTIRVVAQEFEIPMFDRFAIMRHWNEVGDFDLFGPVHGLGMAKRVHDCIGRALATQIIEAARINPAELRIQR